MRQTIPIPQKLLLTVEEAAEYSRIGEHRIRELLEAKDCDFVLKKGTFSLIKRVRFENYILERAVI